MKRKKWSEVEEQSLLSKYAELHKSGALGKLKTREKKFKPIADHVNSLHHISDPITFPFKWSWRDVSIKVQNMRHQYLGVKQKIRLSNHDFNWKDGENHWENFLRYKEVFGDVELDPKGKKSSQNFHHLFGDCGDLGFGLDCDYLDEDEDQDEEEEEEGELDGGEEEDGAEEEEEEEEEDDDGEEVVGSEGEFGAESENGEMGFLRKRKLKKGLGVVRRLGLVGATRVLELRDVVVKREERRREREFKRERGEGDRDGEEKRKEIEFRKEKRRIERDEWLENRELDLEERQMKWTRRESERRLRMEQEFAEERRRRMRVEEKREEEEMEWRERIVGLQIEHEKQMMQMHAEACQNQMQILGLMARLVCQFFGSPNDGLGGGLGALPPQVLQNLQHPGGLDDNGKPDANSPSEFI